MRYILLIVSLAAGIIGGGMYLVISVSIHELAALLWLTISAVTFSAFVISEYIQRLMDVMNRLRKSTPKPMVA